MRDAFLPADATPRACRLRLNEIEAWVRRHGTCFPPTAQVLLRSLLEDAASTPGHVNALIEWLRALYGEVRRDEVVIDEERWDEALPDDPRATSSRADDPGGAAL